MAAQAPEVVELNDNVVIIVADFAMVAYRLGTRDQKINDGCEIRKPRAVSGLCGRMWCVSTATSTS